VVRLVE